MTLGSRTRRVASGLAAGVLVALAGCRAMPVGRIALPNSPQSTLASASRAALLPATVAMDPPSEMSSIEPVAINPASITPAVDPSRPAPTPLLDAALVRAKGIEEASSREKVDPPPPEPTAPTPAPTPEPAPPSPAPAPAPALINSVEFPVMAPAQAQEPPKEPESARPEDAWRDGVRKLAGLARARLEQPSGGGSGSPWALRARILAWLAEPDLDPDLGRRESDGIRSVLRALDDAQGDSPRRGDEVRSAVLALEDRAPLEITDLRLCSKVDGFGDFEAFEPPVRKAGQAVVLYCELDGLRFEQSANGFRTRVAAQLEILPQGGGPPIHTRPLEVAEETCRRRRRDYYIAYILVLPRPLEPGDYRLRLTTKDLNSDRSIAREVAFAIARD